MKTLQTLLLLICLITIACQSNPEATTASNETDVSNQEAEIDFEKEKAAIMKVLEGESAAFWNKDYEKWASYWVHEPYIRTMGWWKDGGVTVVEGWEERGPRTKKHMESSPKPNTTATTVNRVNLNFRIFKEVAWLTFDQYGEDTGDSLMDMPGLSRESRIFEKHDGQWKIVYTGWLLAGTDEGTEG